MSNPSSSRILLPNVVAHPNNYWVLALTYMAAVLHTMPAAAIVLIALTLPIGKRQHDLAYRTIWLWGLGLVAAVGYLTMYEVFRVHGLRRSEAETIMPFIGLGVAFWHMMWVKPKPQAATVTEMAEPTTEVEPTPLAAKN